MTPMLFVYGTLRLGADHHMARWLRSVATHVGTAQARGALYRIADYPGFVPGMEGKVSGDLFALADPETTLACLDDYEECAPRHPMPHEYRRTPILVDMDGRLIEAWTYVYALEIEGLHRISGGDFLNA